MSYARAHFQSETAHAAAEADSLAELTAYQQLLVRLRADKATVKAINGMEDKAAAKADLLPQYQAWVDGVLSGDTPAQGDKIIPTVLIWQLDCGQLDAALPLAQFAMDNNIETADEFQRDMAELVPEEYAEQIMRGHPASEATLDAITGWVTDKRDDGLHRYNINDNIRAKVLRTVAEQTEERDSTEALRLYRLAQQYNPKIGVKKRIAELEKT